MDKVKLYNGYEIRSYERERDRRWLKFERPMGRRWSSCCLTRAAVLASQ
jgi:hypothetical protein